MILQTNGPNSVTWRPRSPDLNSTLNLVKSAFAGIKDKSGKEYYLHCVSVMNRLPNDATDDERMVALLHDIVEDTDVTLEDLRSLGYSSAVIDAVNLVTRPEGAGRKAYLDWIRDIAASGNRMAIRVKIADNEDNSDPARVDTLPEDFRSIVRRYERSLAILRPALAEIEIQRGDSRPIVGKPDLYVILTLVAVMVVFALLVSPILAVRLFLFFAVVYLLVKTVLWMGPSNGA